MPYDRITQLPQMVKENLPKHAQDIYKKAYNNAWQQYSREDTAHKVAWSAVKKKYKKEGGSWKAR